MTYISLFYTIQSPLQWSQDPFSCLIHNFEQNTPQDYIPLDYDKEDDDCKVITDNTTKAKF